MNKKWKRWIALGLAVSCLGSAAVLAEGVQTKSYIVHADSYQLPYEGNEKAFKHHINPGYGSALALKDIKTDGTIEFYAITDRGPNGDIPTYIKNGKKVSGKFFPTPDFAPSIGVITVRPGQNRADITESIPLKVQGKAITGKPVPKGMTGSTKEIALNFKMKDLGTDINGLDTEGLAIDKDGNFWISDEYGPFIVKADKNGNIVEKFAPGAGLPSILASRVPNRGSEGLTIDEQGHIFALIQSPLNVDGKTGKTSKYTRIVELDPVTKDLIYKVDLNGATPVANNGDLEYGRLDGKLIPARKELVLDLRANGWNIEKAEGLALLPDRRTIAVVNDNDFGMDIAVQDPKAPSADVSDYTYDSDKKVMIYNKDKTVHKVKLSLKKNAPSEQESQIWFFTLPKSL